MPQEIGTELKIKTGETVNSGRLKITYIGILSEEKRAQNLNLENIESFFFEIEDTDKIYKRKTNDTIVINDLIIKVIKEKSDSSAATVIVMNEKMAKRAFESDVDKLIESYENAKIVFERLADLMGDPAPDSIVVSLSSSEENIYITFSSFHPNSVSLNGVELKGEIGMYWIKSNLLKKTNLLMLYYRGEVYTASFEIELASAENHYSFKVWKVKGKKILRNTK